MILTIDIGDEEFDSIVDSSGEFQPIIFLNFASDIKGLYEFELANTVINIFDFEDQLQMQGFFSKEDSLFVFGKLKVQIDGVKGANLKWSKDKSFKKESEKYYNWPYTINKDDRVCYCGGYLSFLTDYYATLMIVTDSKYQIKLTFDLKESIPFNSMDNSSLQQAKLKQFQYKNENFQGKLFDTDFFKEYFLTGRKAIKDE